MKKLMVRLAAGLVLLSWLGCPASVVVSAWTGDWRWAVTGFVVALTTFVGGVVVIECAKKAKARSGAA